MKYFIVLLALVMSACSCSSREKLKDVPLPTCAEFLKSRVGVLESQGFEVVGGAEHITAEGAMIMGQLAREDGTLILDVLVDNGALVKAAKKEGLKEKGKCLLGEGTWTLMTTSQKVKTLPGKDEI